MAPMMKRMSASRMTHFRPRRSARMPEVGETRSAKREVHAVMRDLSRVVRGRDEREEPMETSVADMTPVSSEEGEVNVSPLSKQQRRGVLNWEADTTYSQIIIH